MKKHTIKNGIFHGKPVCWTAVILLAAALVLSLLWAVTIGSVDLAMGDVYRVILFKLFGIGDAQLYGSGSMSDIVWYVRLPRLILAIAIGASLSIAGVVMQAIVKNPLADPYVLGISSGASLGATIAIILGIGTAFGSGYVGIMAFIGAFLVSIGVIVLANMGGKATSVKLILAGTALRRSIQFSALCQKQQLRCDGSRDALDNGQSCFSKLGNEHAAVYYNCCRCPVFPNSVPYAQPDAVGG